MDIKWLAEQLQRPGLSQAGLARALGKSQSAISRILSGQRQLKASELPVILRYVGHVKAPADPAHVTEHNAALGQAFSEWNDIENYMSALAVAAFGSTGQKSLYVLAMINTPRTYVMRMEMLDNVLNEHLKSRRNDLEVWRSLRGKIEAAGLRRDRYARSVTISTTSGRVLGFAPDHGYSTVTTDQLREDAQLFQAISKEMKEFYTLLQKG